MIEEKKHRLVFVFFWLPKICNIRMRYALDEKLIVGEGMPEPGLHIPRWPLGIRAKILSGHRKVVCLFKEDASEGARWPLWKRGRNPTTRHRNIDSQPVNI